MCGVWGFVGKPDKNTPKNFRYLGFLNESRGRDSTGFCAFTKDEISLVKDSEKATKFLSDFKNIKQLIKFSEKPFCILMGHTRQATVGAVSKKNAHPFKIGKIIMTHNGHINNFQQLKTDTKTDYEVDSQIIGHLLATESEKDAFQKIDGWFTIPYINIDEHDTLNVAISKGAQFSYAIRENQVYYSSSSFHLEAALAKEKGFKFFEGQTDMIYRFYLWNKYMVASEEKLENVEPVSLSPATRLLIGKSLHVLE